MWPNAQFPVDLVPFNEEILNAKLHFCEVFSIISTWEERIEAVFKAMFEFMFSKMVLT